ncbi:tRNA guanosine(34) transglycosylase Tgt [Candidatus Saccharibacteria bacterium]|nr:tRNA guanosine(34) transglycosylase Tgt [Candidatus Saccharibacteria bacterium]
MNPRDEFKFEIVHSGNSGVAKTAPTPESPPAQARAGIIHTPHGQIETPAFVAASTLANVKGLTWAQVDQLGAEAALANTYHLILQPGTELIERAGGLSKFMGYNRPTFTDSGGFQIMSLPNVKIDDDGVTFRSHINGDILRMTPESSMQAQWQIGADIHMAFDCPVGYGDTDTSRPSVLKTMKLTHDWADRCLEEQQKLAKLVCESESEDTDRRPTYQALFGVIQGGEFDDLREESARFFASRDFDGYAIGGMYDAIKCEGTLKLVNEILPGDKPRHWLGMGAEPRDLFVGVEHGIDTFDCVAPTRQARNGSLYTRDGRINIKNSKYREDFSALDPECGCYTCQNHTRAYLAHLFRSRELTAGALASIHNEYFVVNLAKQIRKSLLDDTFVKFKQDFLARYYAK